MNKQASSAPRVTRIEIHYDDGSKDELVTAPKSRTEIPLFCWTRSLPDSKFEHAYTNGAVAAVLFQTALTRRLMDPNPRDKDTFKLREGSPTSGLTMNILHSHQAAENYLALARNQESQAA